MRILILLVILLFTCIFASCVERFEVTDSNVYDMVIKPQSFDLVNISDAMTFKERKSDEIKQLLENKTLLYSTISRDTADANLKRQLGQEYNIVFWKENDQYYDIVVHAPGKMYGLLLFQLKNAAWEPKLVGYIFEDKLNMISGHGTMERLMDFRAWPFNNDI